MSVYNDISNAIKAHFRRYKKLPNTLTISRANLEQLRKENPSQFTIDHRQETFYVGLHVIVKPSDVETRVTRKF